MPFSCRLHYENAFLREGLDRGPTFTGREALHYLIRVPLNLIVTYLIRDSFSSVWFVP